jgi:hypothetical protein
MNPQTDQDVIQQLLRRLPKPSIPADLVAAIERETSFKKPWWQSEALRLRWMPAALGLATALGVLWLSRIQKEANRRTILPMAAVPARPKETLSALLPQKNDEMSNSEKGESREQPKS